MSIWRRSGYAHPPTHLASLRVACDNVCCAGERATASGATLVWCNALASCAAGTQYCGNSYVQMRCDAAPCFCFAQSTARCNSVAQQQLFTGTRALQMYATAIPACVWCGQGRRTEPPVSAQSTSITATVKTQNLRHFRRAKPP
jgi:hypothetical protein